MTSWPILFAAASTLALPVPTIDHAKGVKVRPKNVDVIMCTSPTGLPLARIAAAMTEPGGMDYGADKFISAAGCIPVTNDDAMIADFQEDVTWAGSVNPPKMLHGTLREVRVRFSVAKTMPGFDGVDAYFYIAAADLRPVA